MAAFDRPTDFGCKMSPPVLFTLDLEDHLGRYDSASRYPDVTRRVMSALAERDITGTVSPLPVSPSDSQPCYVKLRHWVMK